EVNVYRGQHPAEERQRTFGGQVAAQALTAAGRTVEGRRVHSLHSYFLRPGDPRVPILYEVDRIRDGRSFATRRVVAIQHGRAIYNMQASFHNDEVSLDHQVAMPDVPGPETVLPLRERVREEWGDADEWFSRHHPIDQRFLGELPWSPKRDQEPRQRLWIRAEGTLPDDDLLHASIITYASDMSLMDVILKAHDVRWDDGGFMAASLDHCMWFHRPVRADEWLLYDTDSPIAHGARGLARGFLFNQAGDLCVSMVQEGLTRVLAGHPDASTS
ncbi:MAG: acyl-CoA thioesterase II, partial [Acidobacteriota bacterium]|nr:acyl-CoA thioesterase II [Acidobacteriota bacterium]